MEETAYRLCVQCPRKCRARRSEGHAGFCGETEQLRLASACLHFGEEPPLTVFGGSGTLFFTGCTLRCAFCQNYQISRQGMGAAVSKEEFARICLKLQSLGAENINLVTASHHIPKAAECLSYAKERGLSIPVAWNSSAYESVESLELLKDAVDIWLPDFKTLNPAAAKELFLAEEYPSVAKKAVSWMIQQAPLTVTSVTKNGMTKEKMMRGVIIRHLVLPGRIDDSIAALGWLKNHADKKSWISLMTQYTPVSFRGTEEECTQRNRALDLLQNRLISREEDETLRDLIEAYGFETLFYQDVSDDTSWLPDFQKKQPFSSSLAVPVWHWKNGFCT